MPVTDAKIASNTKQSIPFNMADEKKVISLSNVIERISPSQFNDTGKADDGKIVSLLSEIEKNTRFGIVKNKHRSETKKEPPWLSGRGTSTQASKTTPRPTASSKESKAPKNPLNKEPVVSKDALSDVRDKRDKEADRKNLSESVKDSLGNWNGKLFGGGGGGGNGELADAAGSASGGVFWSAAKELSEAAGRLGSDSGGEKSLIGSVVGAIKDKTGITKAQEKISSIKENAVGKVNSWAGNDKQSLPGGYKKDKNGKIRNEKGHFVSGPQKTMLNTGALSNEDSLATLEDILDTLKDNEKASGKRQDALVKAVESSGRSGGESGGGGGLFGSAMNLLGGKGKKGLSGKLGKIGGKLGRFGKLGGKLGKLGKLGGIASLIGGGLGFAGMLGGGPDDGQSMDPISTLKEKATDKITGKIAEKTFGKVSGKATASIAEKGAGEGASFLSKFAGKETGKGASILSKFAGGGAGEGASVLGKLSGKGLLKAGASGAGKMLRALGPIATIATAGFDAYQGWNDKEMQGKAFGLKEGEKASTGQKAASAAANVLDMGGLVSGGLSMLGADLSTADIAKGVYKFFGGEKKNKEDATGTGASRMLHALGPVAGVATAGLDAFNGWNDKELQSKAFGLKEGEKASTGQKAASAAANLLDMGGLVSGGLSMLGADVSTSDIAEGVWKLFGGEKKNKEGEATQTADLKKPTTGTPVPESVRQDNLLKSQSATGAKDQASPLIDKLAKQIEKLSNAIDPEASKNKGVNANKEKKSRFPIKTDFDDTTLTLMAYDRI